MARPTRNPPSTNSLPSPVDPKSKKRKREPSLAGDVLDGRPAAKLPKADAKPDQSPPFELEYLDPHDAHKILTILETVDTNGFLDRIFNVPSSSTAPPVSLRTLLRDPGRHSADVLRDALRALLPLSSQPRALLAPTAAEKQRFVELGSDLVDQALTRSGLSQSMDVILQGRDEQAPELDADERKRLYALVQRLPSGDWWSSAIIPRGGSVGITRAEASALSTKQAELAMVVPSLPLLPSEVPTLGTLKPPVLKPSKDPGWQATYLPQRKLHAPKLLDWGPYMTFAPAYDAADCELGPGAAFQTTYESVLRRKARAARKQLEEKMRRKGEAERKEHMPAVDSGDVEMSTGLDPAEDDRMDLAVQAKAEKGEPEHVVSSATEEENGKHFSAHEAVRQLHWLFSPDEAEVLKEAFQQLELELGISELLHYIIISLQNLVDMQRERLGAGIQLEPDSLEQQTAQEITKSLTLLVSTRPRSYEQPNKSLIPPPAILHALHRSLPGQPTAGWRGTLAGNRPTALRDDQTVTIKTTARAQAAAQAASQLYPQSAPSQPVPTPAPYPNGAPAQNFGRGGPMPSPMTPGPFMGPYGNYYPNYYSGYPSPAPTPGPYGGTRPIPDMTKSQGQGQPPIPKGWQGYPVPPAPSASAIPPHMTGVFRPGVPPPPANKSFYR